MPGILMTLRERIKTIAARRRLRRDRRGAVTIVFATAAVPLLMATGLAVDYSFYIQAQSQLSLAADSAAIHAVRIASQYFIAGNTNYGALGATAGQQWFAAQLGIMNTVALGTGNPVIPSVTYATASGTFTAQVSYTGTMTTNFGGVFKIPTWTIAGTSTAVINTNNYVQISMLLDNSSSMMIPSTVADIETMEKATPCAVVDYNSATGAYPGLNMGAYSYTIGGGYGYTGNTSSPKPPPYGVFAGKYCDPHFDGPASECQYPPYTIYPAGSDSPINNISYPQCEAVSGGQGGAPGSAGPHTPQAPCAFACHELANGRDYYNLAENVLHLTLRLDVVRNAAALVISNMQDAEQVSNQFSVSVYTFNNTLTRQYPAAGAANATGTDLPTAQTTVTNIATPVTLDNPNTDFAPVFTAAATALAATAGVVYDGSTPAKARRNLFIVTDGLQDSTRNGSQTLGPVDSILSNPCAQLKAQGFTVYVLYTPYYPLTTNTYTSLNTPVTPNYPSVSGVRSFTSTVVSGGADTPVVTALKACSSDGVNDFFQASSSDDINAAMSKMLKSALNQPGRLSQ